MLLPLRPDLLAFAGCLVLAVGISTLLTPLVGRWSVDHGVVALPRADRWHSRATPLLGGIAIYFATTLAILAFARLDLRLIGLLVGGGALFVTGLVDDLRRLRPHTKLIAQILAACLLVVSGVKVESVTLSLISFPLTILWVVGLTNAFNLLDNMDGLSAGTAVIASFFLFAFSISVGNVGLALLCLAVAGASLGFLAYNFNPARIFMGDSGSMFLGFTLSGIALLGTHEMASDIFFVMLVPAAMMGLPIFDTTLVTIVRTLEGRPLAQGGRDHLSHRLVALGLSERQAVLLLYAFAASFGSLGLIARSLGLWTSIAVGGTLVVLTVLFGAFLAQIRIYGPKQFARAERTQSLADRPIVNGMIMFKRELGLAGLDFVLICLAYLGAFILRFGYQGQLLQPTDISEPWPRLLSETLPFVIVVKLMALWGFRVYRGMMRYIGVPDLMTFGKATVASSVVLVLLLPVVLRGSVYPRSLLIIDWLLFTTLLVGSRASFAGLSDTFARLQQKRLAHLVIVGAGDLGEIVLRALIRSRPSDYQAIGFLDPDPAKRNRSIHGVRVLGTLDVLDRLASTEEIDLVVLALPNPDALADARARCEALDLPYYTAATFMELHFSGALSHRDEAPEAAPAVGAR